MSSVQLQTSLGSIVLEMYDKEAPVTVLNFKELVKRNYYNGTIFHRIIKDFMIQGGDPTGTGRGGKSSFQEPQFHDEIHPGLKFTGAGILAMANAGPNTNASQFFLTLAPTPHLNGKHTIFGRVSSGMGVVEKLGLVDTDERDQPKEDVRIVTATVLQ